MDYNTDLIPLLRGIFSGDANPILQNKYCITHNLAFNNKEKKSYLNLLTKIFPDTKINIIQRRFVVYSSWEENRKLLLNDIYKFNPLNKAKFAKQFFSLPRTKKSMLNDIELKNFKRKKYPKIVSELLNTYRKLVELQIQNDDFIKEKEKEWMI